jgi:hypothetical protein
VLIIKLIEDRIAQSIGRDRSSVYMSLAYNVDHELIERPRCFGLLCPADSDGQYADEPSGERNTGCDERQDLMVISTIFISTTVSILFVLPT